MEISQAASASPVFFDLFARVVASLPDSPAISFDSSRTTYGELWKQVNRLAKGLEAAGVGPGSKVAVGVPRNEMLVPLLIAIWARRAAYVPVDPEYPVSRQSYILHNSGAALLVSDKPDADLQFSGLTIELRNLLVGSEEVAVPARTDARDAAADVAYLIYTSGSTGNPKGVAVTQGNVVNFLLGMDERPGLSASDRLLAVTTISFDIHVLELFLPLIQGAELILASRAEAASAMALRDLIGQHRVTFLQATPSTWRMLLADGWVPPQPLKILVGGEALPPDLLPAMFGAAREVWNMYGPTETTVWSTCHRVMPGDHVAYIGTPIRNTRVAVVDEHLQPVPTGTAGELLIGGDGVTNGYHNNRELTDERFIRLTSRTSDGLWYRTGDAVVQLESGVLQYINRLDNQIKIRGYRIEPLDIEHCVQKFAGISQAIVVPARFSDQDARLVCYYLGQKQPANILQAHCVQNLPGHMVPQHFVHLLETPLTANLKVDRKKLAEDARRHIETTQEERAVSGARDDLDVSLIRIFETALGATGIGIDDNFFQIGGHSLLALQVVREIQLTTGLQLSDTILFEAPTIRALREKLSGSAQKLALVLKLNNTCEGEPIFCLCGIEIYQQLAEMFEAKHPVYSVVAKEEIAFIEAQKKHKSLSFDFDELVKVYVDAIKRHSNGSALSLVGLSFGGLVALEAARILKCEGTPVCRVVLLDSYMHGSTRFSPVKVLIDTVDKFRTSGFVGAALAASRRVKSKLSDNRRLVARKINPEAENQREKAFDKATEKYRTANRKYDFDVLLIKASGSEFGFGRLPKKDYGLSRIITGKLTISEVPAVHTSMLRSTGTVKQIHQLIDLYPAGGAN